MTSTLHSIASALPSLGRARLLINSADDVVIVAAVRTAITKVSYPSLFMWPETRLMFQAKKGGFKDCLAEDLLSAVFTEVVKRAKVDPAKIEDIAVGNVLPPGGGANMARAAQLFAGIPYTYSMQCE